MTKHFKTISFCLTCVILLFTMFVGCDQHQTSLKQPSNSQTDTDRVFCVENFTDKQLEIYKKLLNSNPNWVSYENLDLVGNPFYYTYVASIHISPSGLEAVPVIITSVNDNHAEPNDDFLKYYWAEGLYAILHINPVEPQKVGESNLIYSAESICAFYRYAQKQIPEIISSDISTEEKILKLKTFGIYAVPYIIEELQNGNDEYSSFFVAIGLHLNNKEYADLVALKYGFSEDMYSREDYLYNAEDFDYKTWYEENKEDLDNLFKFLDAYCAEYEAEMKTE